MPISDKGAIRVRITKTAYSQLTRHAVQRRLTVEELAGRLLDAIASDNLVDAVIDDGRRASASIAAFS